MKHSFTFSVLRYVHDAVTGEFVNVGVFLSCPELGFAEGRFESRYRRISDLFGREIDGHHFRSMVRSIESGLRSLAQSEGPLFKRDSPEAVVLARRVLPLDDSALQFHPGGGGLTDNPNDALDYLFGRHVTQYILGTERPSRTDDDVLSVLKESLVEADLGSAIHPFPFKSRAFEHVFPISWQNGRVNLCQALSFDLLDSDSIRDKAYRWAGRSKSIHEEAPEMRLVFFLGLPGHVEQRSAFRDGREILNRFVEGEHLVVDEDHPADLIREVQIHH